MNALLFFEGLVIGLTLGATGMIFILMYLY